MGITQIDIKINQTKSLSGGKPKAASLTEEPVNSFEQIFAVFNNLGQPNKNYGQTDTPSLKNVAETLKISEGENQSGLVKINPDEVAQVDFLESSTEIPKNAPVSLKDIKSSLMNLSAEATNSDPVILEDINSNLMNLSLEVTENGSVSLGETQSSLINLSTEVDQDKPVNEGEEDWAEIDAILTGLAARIQQVQQSPASLQYIPVYDSSTDGPQTSLDSTTLSLLPNEDSKDSKVNIQGMQMVQGIDQLTMNDSSQWIERFVQIISDLSSNIENKTLEVPDTIEEKIQIILNELNSKKQTEGLTLSNSQFNKNGLKLNEIEQSTLYESKPVLSLDKNQVMFSSVTNTVSRAREESRIVRNPLSLQNDEMTKASGLPLMAIHQQQVPRKELNTASSPSMLSVSEFAPEVSEWIGRYMKITNGQQGSSEAKFSLYPEHLGHIEIKINTQQGQISAEILTDTPIAKQVLEGQLSHLRAALQQSGLHVQRLDIVQQSTVSADPNQAGLSFSQDGSHSSREQRTYTPSQDGSKEQKESTEQKERDRESLSITYGGSERKTTSRIDFTA